MAGIALRSLALMPMFEIEGFAGLGVRRLQREQHVAPGNSDGPPRALFVVARLFLRVRRLTLGQLLLHEARVASDRRLGHGPAHGFARRREQRLVSRDEQQGVPILALRRPAAASARP
jgi:hypothetical protein